MPLNPAKPLQLYDFSWDTFQRLCADMFRNLPEVGEVQLYGTNGQKQDGIDLLITLKIGPKWVGQCKACEPKTQKQNLKEAFEEFKKYLTRWKSEGVTKLIILLGCGLDDRHAIDDKLRYERELLDKGIELEVWDSCRIERELGLMRSVVQRYFPTQTVEERICGPIPRTTSPGEAMIPSELLSFLWDSKNAEIEQIRVLIQEGKETEAESKLLAMRTSSGWGYLPPDIRARVLRVLAGLELNRRGNITKAQNLVAEAKREHPNGQFAVIEASIRLHAEDAHAALQSMPESANIDEWNMRAALLLNAGKSDEALRELEAPAFEPNTETLRLKAMAFLIRREPAKALLCAQQAEKQAPTWVLVQEVLASAHFFCAVSPAFDGWGFWTQPVPVPWDFVRTDGVSKKHMEAGADCYFRLAKAFESNSNAWASAKTGELACLACIPDRQSDAEKLVSEILSEHPGHPPVVHWALTRGYKFDEPTARKALEAACASASAGVEPVLALFHILTFHEQFEDAGGLLDAHRSLFESTRGLEAWQFMRGQVLMVLGYKDKADELLGEMPEGEMRRQASTELLRMEGERCKWTPELLARMEAQAPTSQSPAALYKACRAHYSAKDFPWIADRAEELISSMGTESALRLALDAAVLSGRYPFCLELMDRHGPLFWGGNPPAEARRLRAQCEIALGDLPNAERDLAQLVENEGNTEDRFAHFEMQIRTGKRAEAVVTARLLLNDPRVNQTGLLRIADATANIDRTVATSAFDRVLSTGPLPRELIPPVIDMGFRLNLEHTVGDLIQKLPQLASEIESPVRVVTLEEMIAFRNEQHEEARRLESEYRRGNIPIHGYATALCTPLAAMLAIPPAGQAEPLYQRWSARIRHGVRTEPIDLPKPLDGKKLALFLDITSLLLAADIGILDVLASEFFPVYISSSAMESLQQQIDRLSHQQPSRISMMRQVAQLVEENAISVWSGDSKALPADCADPILQEEFGVEWLAKAVYAREHSGLLVDFLPVINSKGAHSSVPDHLAPFVCDPGTVLATLIQAGRLSIEEQEHARNIVQIRVQNPSTPTLLESAPILLDTGLAEHLAGASLLRAVSTYARVLITQDELSRIHLELKSQAEREALKEALVLLVHKIRGYLETGDFQMKAAEAKSVGLSVPKDGPLWRSLYDLIDENRAPEVVTCCDDRLFSRYSKVGHSPVCGTFDLLWHLRQNGHLSVVNLFTALYRMRAANMRYLPLSVDEIVHHVLSAEVKNGMLVETPELEVLRQSAAASLLDWEAFQNLPPGHPLAAEHSEVAFLIHLQNVVVESILQIWKTEEVISSKRIAVCDWILFSLWTSTAGVLVFRVEPSSMHPRQFFTGITSFVVHSMSMKGQEQRRQFFDWLFSRIGTQESLLNHVGTEIREMLLSLLDRSESKQEQALTRHIVFEIYIALPPRVRAAIHFTEQQNKYLGWRNFHPIQFGDYVFSEDEFWVAAEQAINGTPAPLSTESPKPKSFSLCAEKNSFALTFTSEDKKIKFRVSDPLLEILSGDFKSRVQCLHKFRSKMDVPVSEKKTIFHKLAKIKSAQTRIRLSRNRLRESFSFQLNVLRESLRENGSLQIDSVRPISRTALLKHLRLPGDIQHLRLPELLEESAKTLLKDENFLEAFTRIASLPVALPEAIRIAYRDLPADKRLQVQRLFAHHHAPPLMRLQWAALMADSGEESINCVVDVIEELASLSAEPGWELFEALLVWAWAWLDGDREGNTPEDTTLLVASWLHASQLHYLLSRGGEEERVAQFFIQDMPPLLGFGSHPAGGFDVASPRCAKRLPILVWGTAEILKQSNLSPPLVERLQKSIGALAFPQSSTPHPDLELLEQDNAQPNALGSFLNRNSADTLAKFLTEDQASQLSAKHMQDLTDSYIARVAADSSNPDLWLSLAIMLRLSPPLPSQRAPLQDLLASFNFKALQAPRIGALNWISAFLCGQAAYFADVFDFNFWRRHVMDLADVLAKPEGCFTVEESSQLLSHSILILANAMPGDYSVNRLSLLAADVTARHPRFGKKLLSDIIRILLREPPDQAAQAWKSITELRFFASRQSHPHNGQYMAGRS